MQKIGPGHTQNSEVDEYHDVPKTYISVRASPDGVFDGGINGRKTKQEKERIQPHIPPSESGPYQQGTRCQAQEHKYPYHPLYLLLAHQS